jgi:capsular exopolysaccharide synthesis family protein
VAESLLVSGPQVILVTSALPGEGKSTTVANLAVAMAESGRRVLICNADFRSPQVQLAFGLENGPGLTDLLTGEDGPRHLADMVHETRAPGVSLVHSGSTVDNAAELVATHGAQMLEEARSLADVVLLDTAPLLVVSDASELLPAVDAVVLVARAGKTTRDAARRASELLDRAGIPVLGVVLIGAQSPVSYYYSGRYGYTPRMTGRGWRSWLPRRRPAVLRVAGKPWRAPARPVNTPGETNGSVREPSATRGPD